MTFSDSDRAAFEAWITAAPIELIISRWNYDPARSWPGQYKSYEVQLAFEAWAAGEARGRLAGIKEAAIKCEQLWRGGYRGEVNAGFAHAIRALTASNTERET